MDSSKPYRKKLVIIVSRFPFPLEKGDKLRAFHQIKELSSTYSITLIATTDSKVSKESIEQLFFIVSIIPLLVTNALGNIDKLLN